MSKLDEALIYEVLSVMEEIPEGRVATYGQIAGHIAPHWKEKSCLLKDEGVVMKDETHVDLKVCRWECGSFTM